MKRRVQVGDLRAAPQLNPQANPLSTYVRPAQEPVQGPPIGPNPWMQLGSALSDFSPRLSQFAQVKSEQDKQLALQQAESLAAQNQAGWRKLIKARPELAGMNPWVGYYYDQAQVKNRVIAFDTQLKQSWMTSEVREAKDPQTFNQWLGQNQQAFLKALKDEGFDDLSFTKDSSALLQKSLIELTDQHTKYRQQRTLELAGIEFQTLITNHTDAMAAEYHQYIDSPEFRSMNASQQTKARIEWLNKLGVKYGQAIDREAKDALTKGVAKGSDLNKYIANAVTATAERAKDESLLDLLYHIPTGSGILGNIPDVRDAAMKARDNINRRFWEEKDREYKEYDRHRERVKDQQLTKALDKLHANPDADWTTEFQELKKYDLGSAISQIEDYQRSRRQRSQEIIPDPRAQAQLLVKSYTKDFRPEETLQLVNQGKIDPGTAQTALKNNSISQYQQKRGDWTNLDTQTLTSYVQEIRSAFKPNVFDMGFVADQSAKKVADFNTRLTQWRVQTTKKLGQPPSAEEVLNKAKELKEEILKSASQSSGFSVGKSKPAAPQSKPARPTQPQQPNKRQQIQKRLSDIDAKLAELKRRKEQQQRGKQ